MKKTRKQARLHRKKRIRDHVRGTAKRPRLTVYRSNYGLYAQVIDDDKGETMLSSSARVSNIESAKRLGTDIATNAKKKKVTRMVFDRAGYRYHGVIKAVVESAREGGLTI